MNKLTDLKIKKARWAGKRLKLHDGGGLYILINEHSKRFYLRYRFRGVQYDKPLGEYPILTLLEARKIAYLTKIDLKNGQLPFSHLQSQMTLNDLFYEICEKDKPYLKEKTLKARMAMYKNHIAARLGHYPAMNISSPEVMQLILDYHEKGLEATASAIRGILTRIYKYAAHRYGIEHDPTYASRGLKKRKKINHCAHIEDKPLLAQLLCDLERGDPQTSSAVKDALRILPYVFTRPSELRYAHYREFDFQAKLWRIPAERMKGNRPHIVPLAKQVLTMIEKRYQQLGKTQYLFPSVVTQDGVISSQSLNKYLYRLGYKGMISSHGFRGTASTALNEMGYDARYIEMQLAHKIPNTVMASYNHAHYLPERTAMMQFWADYLDQLKQNHAR